MTIAERARAHPLWVSYVAARERGAGWSTIADDIAADLELSDRQRLVNLPKIAAQTGARGRPRSKERCPHCGK